MIFLVAPTYKEPTHVGNFLSQLSRAPRNSVCVVIINANPGDASTVFIKEYKKLNPDANCVIELKSHPTKFWSASVNIGVDYFLNSSKEGDFLALANIDSRFDFNNLTILQRKSEEHGRCITTAPAHSNGRISSTGVKMRSWLFYLSDHIYRSEPVTALESLGERECDYSPTRLILIPREVVFIGGKVDEVRLPHYTADYEFTSRLRRLSRRTILLVPSAAIHYDSENTGNDPSVKTTTLIERLRKALDIKSTYNIRFRARFILLTFPSYSIPGALSVCFMKTMLEISMGRKIGLVRELQRYITELIIKGGKTGE